MKDEQDSNIFWRTFVAQSEDKMCVLMGNKDTLVTVHAMNLVVYVLFFMQGFYMFKTVTPTLRNVTLVQSVPVENAPETLAAAGWKAQDPKLVHKKTKKFFSWALLAITIFIFSTILRIVITADSLNRENKLIKAVEIMMKSKQED